MTGCSSYFSLKVIHLDIREILFHYDVLVLCPPSFNITLRAPAAVDITIETRRTVPMTTNSFQVVLGDWSQNYSVFLTDARIQNSQNEVRGDTFIYLLLIFFIIK